MTDHWEEVGWDKEALTHANVSLTWLDDQVAMLETPTAHRNHHRGRRGSFLVPMHGGIWTMCVSLSGERIFSLNFYFVLSSDLIFYHSKR